MTNALISMLLLAFPLYLDPGSGSFIIQLILAAALGLGVGIRMYWAKIKRFLRGKKDDPSTAAAEDENED